MQEAGPSTPSAPLQQQLTPPLTPSTPLTPTAPSPDRWSSSECVVCMEHEVRLKIQFEKYKFFVTVQKFCFSAALKETVICSPILLCVTVTGDLPAVWACMLLPDLQRCPAVLPSVPWLYISAGPSLPRLKPASVLPWSGSYLMCRCCSFLPFAA